MKYKSLYFKLRKLIYLHQVGGTKLYKYPEEDGKIIVKFYKRTQLRNIQTQIDDLNKLPRLNRSERNASYILNYKDCIDIPIWYEDKYEISSHYGNKTLDTFLRGLKFKKKKNKVTILANLACHILKIINYLHLNQYILSDIKMANIMVKDYHVMFIDTIDWIKESQESEPQILNSDSLSPEVLYKYMKNKTMKWTRNDDYWAIGIMFAKMFDICNGIHPDYPVEVKQGKEEPPTTKYYSLTNMINTELEKYKSKLTFIPRRNQNVTNTTSITTAIPPRHAFDKEIMFDSKMYYYNPNILFTEGNYKYVAEYSVTKPKSVSAANLQGGTSTIEKVSRDSKPSTLSEREYTENYEELLKEINNKIDNLINFEIKYKDKIIKPYKTFKHYVKLVSALLSRNNEQIKQQYYTLADKYDYAGYVQKHLMNAADVQNVIVDNNGVFIEANIHNNQTKTNKRPKKR